MFVYVWTLSLEPLIMNPFRGLEFFSWMTIWMQNCREPDVTLERVPLCSRFQTQRMLCISCQFFLLFYHVEEVAAGLNHGEF